MLLVICYINLCATMILLLGDLDGMAFVLSLGQCYMDRDVPTIMSLD